MSGTAAKSSRRSIRRAFGEEAVNVIGAQDQALTAHATAIREHRAVLDGLDAKADFLATQHLTFLHRGLWQRLMWLVLGR